MTDLENREAFEDYIMGLDRFKRRSPKFLFLLDDGGTYDHQDILALYDAWNASTKRQGYKLAPLEPTLSMIEAAAEEHATNGASYKTMFKAMINAV